MILVLLPEAFGVQEEGEVDAVVQMALLVTLGSVVAEALSLFSFSFEFTVNSNPKISSAEMWSAKIWLIEPWRGWRGPTNPGK